MSWEVAIRLTRRLRADPSSDIAASAEGWDYPFSRLEAMTADLWDLDYAKAGSKRPAKYPRPYKDPSEKKRRGNAAGRTPEQVHAALRHSGPGEIQAPV